MSSLESQSHTVWDCQYHIAATIAQSCYRYGEGKYLKSHIERGLNHYRRAYGKSEFDLRTETRLIKAALKAYVVFQLVFCITDLYMPDIRNPEQFKALKNFFDLMHEDYDQLFRQ